MFVASTHFGRNGLPLRVGAITEEWRFKREVYPCSSDADHAVGYICRSYSAYGNGEIRGSFGADVRRDLVLCFEQNHD